MKPKIIFSLLVMLMITLSCNEQEMPVLDDSAGASDAVSLQDDVVSNARTSAEMSTVYTFAGMMDVGSAYLNRIGNGFTVNLKTTGLTPGYTYTLWAVVFNVPGNCTAGCDEPDIFDLAVEADVLYIAGHVAGNNGKGNFSGHLKEGDSSGSIFPMAPAPNVPIGMIDADAAEIHFVIRCHGPKIPGQVGEQINSFNGGCPGGVGCEDIQFAVFPPTS